MKNIRLHVTPDQSKPPVETYENLVITAGSPYSQNSITLLINPSVSDFKSEDDKSGIKIRNMIFLEHNTDTVQIFLSIGEDAEKEITMDDKKYTIKLLSTGNEKYDNAEFPYFNLLIEKA